MFLLRITAKCELRTGGLSINYLEGKVNMLPMVTNLMKEEFNVQRFSFSLNWGECGQGNCKFSILSIFILHFMEYFVVRSIFHLFSIFLTLAANDWQCL